MKVSDAFPSDYLKAVDLKKRTIRVVIESLTMENIGSDNKPVIFFQDKEKGLVLNKTNANNIAYLFGDETDNWVGKEIELFPTIVDFQGRPVEAIRVRPVSNNSGQQTTVNPARHEQEPPPPAEPDSNLVEDDEIPF